MALKLQSTHIFKQYFLCSRQLISLKDHEYDRGGANAGQAKISFQYAFRIGPGSAERLWSTMQWLRKQILIFEDDKYIDRLYQSMLVFSTDWYANIWMDSFLEETSYLFFTF